MNLLKSAWLDGYRVLILMESSVGSTTDLTTRVGSHWDIWKRVEACASGRLVTLSLYWARRMVEKTFLESPLVRARSLAVMDDGGLEMVDRLFLLNIGWLEGLGC